MAGFFKTIFVTALLVCGATVVTVATAVIASMALDASVSANPPPPVALLFAFAIVFATAILAGMFFCILTLFAASVTMPPVIWIARWLALPRPAVDIGGGMLAAWWCAAAGLDEARSLAQYGLTFSKPIVFGVALVAGGLIGYLRFRWLSGESAFVRPGPALPAI